MRQPKTESGPAAVPWPITPGRVIGRSVIARWLIGYWRPIAVAGSALSFASWALTVWLHRPELWSMVDLQTYRSAVASLQHGQSAIYTRSFGPWPGPFIYPPFAAVLFKPLPMLSLAAAKQAVTLVSFLALGASVWCVWGQFGLRTGRDRAAATALVAAGSLWLEPVSKTFSYGQVSLVLMAMCLLDLAKPDRRRSGLLIGLAAGIKLTPLVFAVYLLATRRYRAAANAFGCFAATVAAGWLILPRAAPQYWFHSIAVGSQINAHVSVANGLNQSIRAMLLRLCGAGRLADALWPAAGALVGLVGLAAAVRAHRAGREFTGILLCAAISLLISPISWTHHWVWIVPTAMALGVTAWRKRSGRLAATAAGYLLTAAVLPLRLDINGFRSGKAPLLPLGLPWLAPHGDAWDLRWNAVDFLIGNSLLLVNLALFAAVCAKLLCGGRPPAAAAELEPGALPRQFDQVRV
jgi:alpha-1,2-mannosyltransferase